jgi:hypothetical protein
MALCIKSKIFIIKVNTNYLEKKNKLNFFQFCEKFRVLMYFFIVKQPKFWPTDNIAHPSIRYGIAWLFRAAVGQTEFRLEVFLNLKPPLNALLNSRPV